jgi:hypothetical protein
MICFCQSRTIRSALLACKCARKRVRKMLTKLLSSFRLIPTNFLEERIWNQEPCRVAGSFAGRATFGAITTCGHRMRLELSDTFRPSRSGFKNERRHREFHKVSISSEHPDRMTDHSLRPLQESARSASHNDGDIPTLSTSIKCVFHQRTYVLLLTTMVIYRLSRQASNAYSINERMFCFSQQW